MYVVIVDVKSVDQKKTTRQAPEGKESNHF